MSRKQWRPDRPVTTEAWPLTPLPASRVSRCQTQQNRAGLEEITRFRVKSHTDQTTANNKQDASMGLYVGFLVAED